MENGVISPGVKQSFTWSTPFFDVTFVDIKSKRGMTNITYVMQDFGFEMSSQTHSQHPHYTLPVFTWLGPDVSDVSHGIGCERDKSTPCTLSWLWSQPSSWYWQHCLLSLASDTISSEIPSLLWGASEILPSAPQPKDSTMPLSRCGHSWPHSSISPHSSTHSISDSHRRHNPPHSTSQSRKDLCVSSENMDMEAGIFGPNSYPIEHLIILIEKNLES